MKLEWMNHTGFVVSDMARSLAFYRDLLGLKEELNAIREGEGISQVVGYPNARLHVVYLGTGDLKHSVELIQYLNPPGGNIAPTNRNDVGATHLGIIVDDLDSLHEYLSARGAKFISPPVSRPGTIYARKVCYLQDPDGNWLELLEGAPTFRFA
jgi:catechol 2,3-dioxygenase-like lactoylglutathione lyase family enzyme